ncbi:hydroxymethylglutaryl-CoA reductase, degradative [Flavobacteriaceae bacterium]|nr:hydroxymethylglutaryl-CoA reductase, degradative [Flavobacteriaceae bacterium]
MQNSVSGFSKFTKVEKIDWLISNHFQDNPSAKANLERYWNSDTALQKLHDEFTENTISNFYLPFGIAPNFLINDKIKVIPMTIEESSVVAAASNAAKFWMQRGGFKAEVISTTKVGQVHFMFHGNFSEIESLFETIKPQLFKHTKPITKNMEARGGGILDIKLINKTAQLKGYHQLHVTFETMDAMGANFINSCLEQIASTFKDCSKEIHVVMSILSNYVPDCLVRAEVSCNVEALVTDESYSGREFADTFIQAVQIAEVEPFRAVTHNKGIMNGVDSVVLATGNDFRAVEAGVHAYAARSGSYSSLTHASIEEGVFRFWIEIPLALGTVGGLTGLHPLVKTALELLGNPSAKELMEVVAVAGLAQNFAALKSLTTTGIQQGHMKMHLLNILNQFEATDKEKLQLVEHFKKNTVTHSAVVKAIEKLRA